ncbi:reverse transcriptase domain-containing protein [Pedobacter sp. Leaf250]|uniref:reverse transcriptase domain-containing protein n=1 Tax=Pedobacter sp. Leaf250 TaxID=2876559 RepID=UPI001E5241FF|nr:reverse transcriptase domain-containing protein [Pedobacter sp. Leaf250]
MNYAQLYSEEIWKEYSDKVLRENKPKTYKHFDHIFDFAEKNQLIQHLVSDPKLLRVAKHSFVPLLKILTKTPRYKYDEEDGVYDLETKIRPISFASHFDSYLYGFYAYALNKKYQDYIKRKGFDSSILAYRSDLNGDCNIQFAKRAFDSVSMMVGKYGKCTAIALDITGYFDNIDHTELKDKWASVISLKELPADQYKIFRSLTNYSYINKSSLLKHFKIDLKKEEDVRTLLNVIPSTLAGKTYNDKFELLRKRQLVVRNKPKTDAHGNKSYRGIPQGSPMSSVLSNIYLVNFDEWLHNRGRYMDFQYMRYCDDLLIICRSEHAQDLIEQVIEEISVRYKLTIQKKKTEIVEFRPNSKGKVRSFDIGAKAVIKPGSDEQRLYKNLQYLGFEFNGSNTYIRPGSLSRYFRKVKGRVLKTMMMAYGKKSVKAVISKKQLYERYSHSGERNFITYAMNAAKNSYKNASGVERCGLDSPSIKRQLNAHFSFLQKEIDKMSREFARQKKMVKKK